jgi:hypothetical protein
MYVYWRIQQDLNCMGEVIFFKDPAFINAFGRWVRKNHKRLCQAQGADPDICFLMQAVSPEKLN